MNIKNIVSIQSFPERNNDVSVIIVDYEMPEMNGLSLLSQLRDKPFKKILLTGKGSSALAVNAFNDGLIHHFLQKDDPDLPQKLSEAVIRLKQQYFIDMSKKTIELLSKEQTIFNNRQVSSFFYETIHKLEMEELYLLDINGSYLVKSRKQQNHYLLMYTGEYIERIADYAGTDFVSEEVMNLIREKKFIPYFGEDCPYWKMDGKHWKSHLKPLKEININQRSFYVALFE